MGSAVKKCHARWQMVLAVTLFVFGLVTVSFATGERASAELAYREGDDKWYVSVTENTGWFAPVNCSLDQYGYCIRNCTSYVAQRLAAAGAKVENIKGLGNGGQWYQKAKDRGFTVSSKPAVGAAAVIPGNPGHVAFVDKVNADGSINVKSYDGFKEKPYYEDSTKRYSHFVYFSNMGNVSIGKAALRSDFNIDGKDDIAWYRNGTVSAQISTGTSFSGSGLAAGFGKPTWAAVGDFNGDGRSDVAWYHEHNRTLYLLKGNPQGHWTAGPVVAGLGKPDWAGVADVNKDGMDDIVWYEGWNKGTISALVSNKTSFYRSPIASGFGRPTWAGTGDFNGDGRGDIAWYHEHNHTLYLLKANSNGAWAAGPVMSNLGRPDWAGAGDFNKDGMTDIAWYERQNNNGTITALVSTQTTFRSSPLANGFASPTWAGVGDFNGDGRSDIAWYHEQNKTLYLLKGNNQGVWAAGPVKAGVGKPGWARAAE